MLPNHNPFVIAEQFGALDGAVSRPRRPGLGRAPGAAPILAQALRKDLHRAAEYFPQDVVELRALAHRRRGRCRSRPLPASGPRSSCGCSARACSAPSSPRSSGCPTRSPAISRRDHLDAALEAYRTHFRPSAALTEPHAMAAMTVICGETDEEAELLASSQDQAFVRLRSGDPGKLPPPVPGYRRSLPESAQAMLERLAVARAVGSPETVRGQDRPVRRAHAGRRDHRFRSDLRPGGAKAVARVDDGGFSPPKAPAKSFQM